MIALVVLWALAGALWRRVLGGWLGLRRPFIVAGGTVLSAPLWFAFEQLIAAPATGLLTLFWVMGHRCDHWTVWLRYGPAAVGYVLARKYWRPSWLVYWRGWFVDGWMAVGELTAGAMVYLAVGSLWLW